MGSLPTRAGFPILSKKEHLNLGHFILQKLFVKHFFCAQNLHERSRMNALPHRSDPRDGPLAFSPRSLPETRGQHIFSWKSGALRRTQQMMIIDVHKRLNIVINCLTKEIFMIISCRPHHKDLEHTMPRTAWYLQRYSLI
jgi:hypothetical protein